MYIMNRSLTHQQWNVCYIFRRRFNQYTSLCASNYNKSSAQKNINNILACLSVIYITEK